MSMSKPQERGFTLIELIIFIVVVAAGLAGILSVMNTVVKSSSDPMVRKQTLAIAESLLEEILLKEYANPTGGDTGTVRAQFDDVDQYIPYTTSGGIRDVLNNPVAGLSGYDVTQVTVATTTDLTGIAAKKITVTISGPGNTVVSLSGYRSQY